MQFAVSDRWSVVIVVGRLDPISGLFTAKLRSPGASPRLQTQTSALVQVELVGRMYVPGGGPAPVVTVRPYFDVVDGTTSPATGQQATYIPTTTANRIEQSASFSSNSMTCVGYETGWQFQAATAWAFRGSFAYSFRLFGDPVPFGMDYGGLEGPFEKPRIPRLHVQDIPFPIGDIAAAAT